MRSLVFPKMGLGDPEHLPVTVKILLERLLRDERVPAA